MHNLGCSNKSLYTINLYFDFECGNTQTNLVIIVPLIGIPSFASLTYTYFMIVPNYGATPNEDCIVAK